MATVALSTSSATLDPGTAYELTVLNSGTVSCHVQIGGGVGYDERLRPGQQTIIYPNGSAVTAFVRSGTGEVTTALSTNPETASSGGGAFLTTAAASGTYVQRRGGTTTTAAPLREFNVLDYGAVGDGSHDDTAAFTAAIAAAAILNGKVVLPTPPTAYRITSSLATFAGLVVEGVGGRRTAKGGTLIRAALTGPLFKMGTDDGNPYDTSSYDGVEGFTLRNVYCVGFGTGGVLSQDGVSVYSVGTRVIEDWRGGSVTVENCMFEGFDHWFWGIQSDFNTFRNVWVIHCKQGFYLGPRCSQNTFYDCLFTLSDKVGTLDSTASDVFDNCSFVGNGAAGINPLTITNASVVTSIVDNIVFESPWVEQYQGPSVCEAWLEIGVGDATAVTGVRVTNPMILTHPQGGGSGQYMQYLIKTGNADRIWVDIVAKGKVSSLAALFLHVGSGAPSVFLTHPFNYRENTPITTPVVNSSTGVLDVLLQAESGGYRTIAKQNSGTPLARYGRQSETQPRTEITVSEIRFGDGSANTDIGIARRSALTAGPGAGQAWTVGGLTGAVAASRYAGATAFGPPTSGTFAVGDFVIDQTGAVFICITAGTPGTWRQGGIESRIPYPRTLDPRLLSGSGTWAAANRTQYMVAEGTGGTLTSLKPWIAVQSGNISLAVYSTTGTGVNQKPGTLLGGRGLTAGRAPTDGVTTNASPTVTSATAAFVATDVGKSISGTGIPANSYIGVVNSVTSIGLSSVANANTPVNATASGTGITLTLAAGIACPPTGLQPVTLDVALALDYTSTYWFALSCDNTTASFGRTAVLGSAAMPGLAWQQSAAFPCPSPAVPDASTALSFQLLGA